MIKEINDHTAIKMERIIAISWCDASDVSACNVKHKRKILISIDIGYGEEGYVHH